MTKTPLKPNDSNAGAELLDQLRDVLTRYVIVPTPEAADAVALWIAASHALAAWHHAPRLVIRAPEKRCGKSRLLDVVEATCRNPLLTVNASPAAVYRAIGSEDTPTLLVDEADTIFGPNAPANEDLRGILNAGHQRNRNATRWNQHLQRLEHIPTFAMAALAGIGAMPDTIEDRAVVIRMRRRRGEETVAPYRHRRDRPPLVELSIKLDKWLTKHLKVLEAAEPVMPLEDRAADTWEPLIAIADLAGRDWPQRARLAAVTLTEQRDETAETSERIRLLIDCRHVFADAEALPTTALIERLRVDPEAPWADLTPIRLASLLREYEIRSDTIRFPAPIGQAKGYRRDAFTDAWQRYAPEKDLGSAEPSADSHGRQSSDLVGGDQPLPVDPYQPYQSYQASSEAVRLDGRYGSKRTTQDPVPGLTCAGTDGTAGTARPHLRIVDDAA